MRRRKSTRGSRAGHDDKTVRVRRGGRARRQAGAEPEPRRRRRLVRGLLRIGFLAGVWGLIGLSLLVGYYAYDLPSLDRIEETTRRPQVTILDRSGARLAVYGDIHGSRLDAPEIPATLRQAVLAIEDRRFYDHWGLDPRGIARAMAVNVAEGGIRQGGSTITQQLAKNIFLTHARSIRRKIQEVLLAVWLEQRFTKEQILALYLNRVYLGKGTYGVDAAARLYFGVSARNLNLYQSAVLAGLLRAPSRLNPMNDPQAAQERAEVVLRAMVEAGFITEAEARGARDNRGIVLQPRRNLMGRYFTDWVLERAADRVSFTEKDLVVVTTLSASLQGLAEESVRRHLPPGENAVQAALVAMRPDGAVRAMIGGRDYGDSQFNRVLMARRQPGSAFKPLVFLAALEAGMTPEDRVLDAPVRVGDWRPGNYRDRYFGRVTIREAMTRSLNSVAVRIAERAGRDRVQDAARRLGIDSPLTGHPSLALGASEVTPLELTGAYAVFANRGRAVEPYAILEIRTADGRVLYRRPDRQGRRVVAERRVEQMNDLLRAVIGWGTGREAQIGRPAAGKTGTSQHGRDGWFVGYTPQLVTGVWMGRDDNRPVNGLTGGGLPAQMWAHFMRRAHAGRRMVGLPGVAN